MIRYIAFSSDPLVPIINRLTDLAIGVSASIIVIFWIFIALSFFSQDENRKMEAYARAKNGAIGTIIYIMAVSGILYALFKYIIVGS
ncbi:hypothetical protein [Caldiplasma sukawensis]